MDLGTEAPGLRASRRTVVRGAAWSVPVVAVATAAPAFAASPCDPRSYAVDWGNTAQYSRLNSSNAIYTIPDPDGTGPGRAVTLTISTESLGSNTQLGPQGVQSTVNDNLRGFTGSMGGSSSTATSLTFHQSPVSNGSKTNSWTTGTQSNRSITRFTFSRPVASLTFTLRDIDSATDDFVDAIALVTAASFTGQAANTSTVIGAGTASNPWRANGSNLPAGGTSTNGNVMVTMTDVTTFDMHYWNLSNTSARGIDGDQKVFLSGMDVTYKPC